MTAQVNAPLGARALEGRKTNKGGARCVQLAGRGRGSQACSLLCPGLTYPRSHTLSIATPIIPRPGSGVPGTWSSSWGCRIGRLCDQPCCSNRGQRGCGGRSCRVGEGLGHREKRREKEGEGEKERKREHTAGVRQCRDGMGNPRECGWG